MEINKIYNENCLDTMKKMPEKFIDLTVTSPPYDNLRTYDGYSFDFEPIARELYRVTKLGGVVVWVVGDASIDGSETGTSFRQALFFKEVGFRLHDTMIYSKGEQVYFANEKRYSQVFEYMFILSKGSPKTVNLIKDKKNYNAGMASKGSTRRMKDGSLKKGKYHVIPDYSIRTNIWEYSVGYMSTTKDTFAFDHPAMFPEKLASDHIRTWSNEGDLVYDPFMGAGTTAKMAAKLNRNYLGSELSERFHQIALKRVQQIIDEPTLF